MATTRLTFLGTATVVPEPGCETACALLNGCCLIDLGWNAALGMRAWGCQPLDVDVIFLTHAHQDHYLGLPGLLFYRRMRLQERSRPSAPLTLAGPAADVARVLERARAFLQVERFPEVDEPIELLPLEPGDRWDDGRLSATAFATRHAVPSLGYRFRDQRTGIEIAYTGDTAPDPGLADAVRGVQLLVTEASYGPQPAPGRNASLHAGAPDAVRLARAAGVQRLALIHCPRSQREATLQAARERFPDTCLPAEGETLAWETTP